MKPIPKAIPPRSIVVLIRVDRSVPAWKKQVGKRFRVGYYNHTHGLDEVWLVDDKGDYVGTATQDQIRKYFAVKRLAKETDYFGKARRRLGPIDGTPLRVRIRAEREGVKLPPRWSSRIIDRFKWPIKPHTRKLLRILRGLKLSRRKQPPLHYFVWPDKMPSKLFEGSLSRLMKFIDGKVSAEVSLLRRKMKERLIQDWQLLIIRSTKKPETVWLGTHRIYFVSTGKSDIFPNLGMQRIGNDKYVVWGE